MDSFLTWYRAVTPAGDFFHSAPFPGLVLSRSLRLGVIRTAFSLSSGSFSFLLLTQRGSVFISQLFSEASRQALATTPVHCSWHLFVLFLSRFHPADKA